MAYITPADVYSYALYNLTSSDVNTATVSLFITDSEALINGTIADLYTVPFSSGGIPDIIKTIDRDFTAFFVCDYLYQQQNRNYDSYVAERYRRANELLNRIKSQDLNLIASLSAGGTGAIVANVNTTLKGSSNSMPLIANMDNFMNWRTPNTLVDSIKSARRAND